MKARTFLLCYLLILKIESVIELITAPEQDKEQLSELVLLLASALINCDAVSWIRPNVSRENDAMLS